MTLRKELVLEDYIKGIKEKDIGILSRAISLIESKTIKDMKTSFQLLNKLSVYDGKSKRIGITGVPGAGKSTFLNSLGTLFCDNKHQIAVLTIDPSSGISGGSILGDKTRMQDLSFNNKAYIRSSPSLGHLGGVAARTRESIVLCEAFGFETIFIESVGVGQSEYELSQMVDLSIMLAISGAGDELQGIKRGLLELADWVLINKADGKNIDNAKRAKQELESALKILRQKGFFVEAVSSIEKNGLDSIYNKINDYFEANDSTIKEKRLKQKIEWFKKLIEQKALLKFRSDKNLLNKVENLNKQIKEGKHPLQLIGEIEL